MYDKKDEIMLELVSLYRQLDDRLNGINKRLNHLEDMIMTTSQEAIDKINAVKDVLVKASAEIAAQVKALQDAAANANLPPAFDEALANLVAVADSLDAMNPDVTA